LEECTQIIFLLISRKEYRCFYAMLLKKETYSQGVNTLKNENTNKGLSAAKEPLSMEVKKGRVGRREKKKKACSRDDFRYDLM
jgi:hypothetical protein